MEEIKPTHTQALSQLAKLFNNLHIARFEEDKDYGPNITGCFEWYLSPLVFQWLETRLEPVWLEMKVNTKIAITSQPWEGFTFQGASIKFIF